jgi:hypothetical protein
VKFRGLEVVESGLWRLLSWGLGGVLLRGILSAALGMRRREIVRVFEAVKCPSHIIGWSRDGSSPGLYNAPVRVRASRFVSLFRTIDVFGGHVVDSEMDQERLMCSPLVKVRHS